MQIRSFIITTIGAVHRNMDLPFSRCHAQLSLAEDGDPAENMITFNIVYRGSNSETIDTRRRKILAECVQLLTEGATLLEGKSIEFLDETTDIHELALGAVVVDEIPHTI